MRRRLLLVAVIAAVAGCGGSSTENAAPTTTLAVASPSPSATVLPEQEQAYLLTLEAIEPAVTSDDLAALAVGYGICARIADKQPRPRLIAYAQTLGTATRPLSGEEADRVVTAAHRELCP